MGYCPSCQLQIEDSVQACPLCRHALRTDGAFGHPGVYPDVAHAIRAYLVVVRILLFVGLCVSVICVFLNIRSSKAGGTFWWSLIVVAVIAYVLFTLWLFVWDVGYLRRIFFTVLGGVGVFLVIDSVTGYQGWSLNYGFPAMVIVLDVVLAALMIFNRKRWESYLVFLILVLLLGLVPLVLMQIGLITKPVVSEIALITAALVFLGAVILGGATARTELQRRFHIR